MSSQAGLLPLALSQRPRGDDPQRDHEDQEHRAGADGHQGLEDEPGVEVDAIQGPYTARRRVREELRVQQHHPTDEVEPEEHRQRESHVVRHPLGADVAVFVRQLGRPQEVVLARNRVDRANHQLQRDLRDPLPGHRDPPVVRAVIDHEQLSGHATQKLADAYQGKSRTYFLMSSVLATFFHGFSSPRWVAQYACVCACYTQSYH